MPTRLVHWLIAGLVVFSWWSATHDHLSWHRLSGYLVLGLLIFRVIWGVAGSETARFSHFLRGPRAVLAYARSGAQGGIGHNPLGGWSIVAMLAMLIVQVGLGLFSVDEDGLEAGPLSKFVDFDTGRAIAHLHHLGFTVLLGLIALHLLAVAAYALRGRHLTVPMITGRATLSPDAPALRFAGPWRVVVAAAVAAGVAWFVARGLRL